MTVYSMVCIVVICWFSLRLSRHLELQSVLSADDTLVQTCVNSNQYAPHLPLLEVLRTDLYNALQGVKAKNEGRGVPSTSLEPQKPASSPGPVSGRSEDADVSSGGQLEDAKAMGEKVSSVRVESLCKALEAASTEEAVVDKEDESGGAGSRRGDAHSGVTTEMAAVKDDRSCSEELGGLGRGERVMDDEKEEQGELEEEVVDDDSEGSYQDDFSSDDEWEPEGEERTEAEAETAPELAFAAGDFPSLTGGDNTAIPSVASTSSVSSPPARQEGSWSLLARSNPAPFKALAKPDPKPVPAAAPVKQHFCTGKAVKGEAGQAISDHNRTDGTKTGNSHILNSAAAFGVSGGGGEDDDGEGWVTPSNFKSHKVAGIGLNGPSQLQKKLVSMGSECRAGCVTTDFAMQNVIIQVSNNDAGAVSFMEVVVELATKDRRITGRCGGVVYITNYIQFFMSTKMTVVRSLVFASCWPNNERT